MAGCTWNPCSKDTGLETKVCKNYWLGHWDFLPHHHTQKAALWTFSSLSTMAKDRKWTKHSRLAKTPSHWKCFNVNIFLSVGFGLSFVCIYICLCVWLIIYLKQTSYLPFKAMFLQLNHTSSKAVFWTFSASLMSESLGLQNWSVDTASLSSGFSCHPELTFFGVNYFYLIMQKHIRYFIAV